jgi:protein arginine N-methyltransferase 5
VIHGLAGYFEAVLYASQVEVDEDGNRPMVELSILPDMIDRKSKDMVSWFPIFFPLKVGLRLIVSTFFWAVRIFKMSLIHQ